MFLRDYRKGWQLLCALNNFTREQYLKSISKYYNYIKNYNRSKTELLDIEILNDQLNWLKNFNNKFKGEQNNAA
jgi:hypothetical protein